MILGSQSGSGRAAWDLISRMRWDKDLVGTKDGVNQVFTIDGGNKFIQDDPIIIRVYRNGVRLRLGVGNDYTVSEGGGVGTGYDTITVEPAPLAYEELTADYMLDL